MARKYRLSWCNDQRWRKIIKGKIYYFYLQPGETKETSYDRCWRECSKIMLGLAEARESETLKTAIDRLTAALQSAQQQNTPTSALSYLGALAGLQQLGNLLQSNASLPTSKLIRNEDGSTEFHGTVKEFLPDPKPWKSHPVEAEVQKIEESRNLGAAVKEFFAEQRAEVDQGNKTAATVGTLLHSVEYFRDFLGKSFRVADIDETVFAKYHQHCVGQVKKGKSPSYIRLTFVQTKQFLTWCWKRRYIKEQLRNLDLSIKVPTKAIETYPLEEIKTIVADGPDILKISFLLMLNCGMTQTDVAQLQQYEVNWETGTVTRKRTKTKNHENVPVVEYKLWPKTFSLLKKMRSKRPHVLAMEDGRPLVEEHSEEDGRYWKRDSIGNLYKYWCPTNAVPQRQLKLLRKTASTRIANHSSETTASLFLGHSPAGIAQKHYLQADQERLDAEIEWLGQELGVAE